MATPCTHCGGELTMVNFEQAFGDPATRRWHCACRQCHTAHEFDSRWTLLSSQVPGQPPHEEVQTVQAVHEAARRLPPLRAPEHEPVLH